MLDIVLLRPKCAWSTFGAPEATPAPQSGRAPTNLSRNAKMKATARPHEQHSVRFVLADSSTLSGTIDGESMMTDSFLDLRRGMVALLAILALTSTTATAHADDTVQDEWYGWQIMPIDAASVGLMVFGVAELEQTAMFSGFAGYALGGPIVHLAHEQWWKSAGSLGLRLGVPMTSLLIVGAFNSSSGNSQAAFADAMGKGILALGVGAVAAMALDYIFLAREPMSSPNNSSSQVQMLQLQWQF